MPAHLIAEEGPLRGLVLNLEEGTEWIIGRDPDAADFVVEDITASRKHARLTKTADGLYLENLSRINPTLINGEEQTGRVPLKEGDRIQIGHTVFLFSFEAIPDLNQLPQPPSPKSPAGGYDDIFGDLEESPEAPPHEEFTQEADLPAEPQRQEKEERVEPTAYDTIFEDTGNEEELPFNLISDTPLLLKVISGPNAGAEIGIEKGHTYSIGKDPNTCEIVFQDLSVSRTHARLIVNAEGVMEIEDLGSKNGTVINGVPITEKRVITPQDLIAMGTTVFLIIDREAPQETIYSPVLPAYALKQKEEPPSDVSLTEEKPKVHWKKQPIPTKHLVTAGAFVLVFFIVFLSFFSLFKSKSMDVSTKESSSEIKEALSKFPGVQFSFNPGSGKLFVVGHILTPVDYQEMRYRLDQIPSLLSIEDTVVIDDGVCKMMNTVLQENADWRSVNLRAVEPGHFSAIGYVQNNAQATALSEYLSSNFPYLDRLTNQVSVIENLTAQLQSLLMMKGFGAVTIQLNNGDVVLSGLYSNKMETEYKDLIKEIHTIAGVTGVHDLATPTSPNAAAIDLSQQYQVSGSSIFDGRGYSAILNGKIYTLGDLIDGMKIMTIEPNTILLEKDSIKYKIEYTR